MRCRFTILRASKLFDGVTRWWTALALRLATQRARASTLHTRSKETILSESRDVAKMKKDSMTAIFPLYCKNILQNKNRQRPTFPGSFPPSIIGAKELNYCVRDGNRCDLLAIVTGFLAC